MSRGVWIAVPLAAVLAGCGAPAAPVPSFVVSPPAASGSAACAPTPADQEGPYYKANPPGKTQLAPQGLPGQRLALSGQVFGPDCRTPIAGAVVDVWQADSTGAYDFSDQYVLRGKTTTDDQGRYRFETILPGYYGEGGAARPRHIHIKVSAPGKAALTTPIYFTSDPNSSDAPAALRIDTPEVGGTLQGVFNVVLANQ